MTAIRLPFAARVLLAVGLFQLATAIPARAAGLVTNGSFADGTFTGWSNPANSGIVIDSAFANAPDVYDAAFTFNGTLSQTIATTAGTAYTLSFSVLDESGAATNSFQVSFGGFSATITGDTASVYASESLRVPGTAITGARTVLSFTGTTSESAWNLDDVALVAVSPVLVPEPSSSMLAGFVALLAAASRVRRQRRG